MTSRSLHSITAFAIPGIDHQTLAGKSEGLKHLEVWSQVVAPGGATPWHRHDCEEVIVVLAGRGRCEDEASACDFEAPAVLTMPASAVHKISNTADIPLRLVAALSMAPVVVHAPSGEVIRLPWEV